MQKSKRLTIVETIKRPNNSILGVSKWTNDTSNVALGKNKILDRCTDKITAMYSPKVGGLKNGLSYKPWMENGVQKEDKEGNKLTLQDKMEQKWNLPKGFLTNKPYRRGDSAAESDLTYYQKKTWALKDGTTILDHTNMDDELGYFVALDSKLIANSERELNSNKYPEATHYITKENEGQEIKYQKTKRKTSAFATLESKALTPTMMKKIITILDLSPDKTTLTEEQRYNLLYDYVENTTFSPGSNIDKYEELVKLLKTSDGRAELEARYLLKKALDYRVMYDKADTYNWPRSKGLLVIGDSYSEALSFLLNPSKQALVEELEEEIKAKTV